MGKAQTAEDDTATGFSYGQDRTSGDLIKCDISKAEGLAAAREQQLFATVCPKFVRDAVLILEEMLSLET